MSIVIPANEALIIGLTGRAGTGKDSVAALLRMWGYQRFAFADALKTEVTRALLHDEPPARLPREFLGEWATLTPYPGCVYQKPTPPAARRLLQWWGTEYRRAHDPDYWVRQLEPELRRHIGPAEGLAVVTDVRFENEAACIKDLGGVVWRVERPLAPVVSAHVSESIESIPVDAVLSNNQTLYDLADRVREAFAERTNGAS